VTLLEHAESGLGETEPLLAEAREIFDALEATPWLERLDALAREAPRLHETLTEP
jgi:hypothetical protein